ncbi:hypothetical protein P5673_022867 [Acropora cervicornis]|uniref:Uncharacterized protein n=1 Tax=Acropora cervicornis TaxID=6130 RepID=A0AAD9UZE6_ACRCE|nr:hypothetical protein P5673_022867 [Acropora cervicornis]
MQQQHDRWNWSEISLILKQLPSSLKVIVHASDPGVMLWKVQQQNFTALKPFIYSRTYLLFVSPMYFQDNIIPSDKW